MTIMTIDNGDNDDNDDDDRLTSTVVCNIEKQSEAHSSLMP